MIEWIIGIALLVAIFWGVAAYNRFVQLRNSIENNYKQIQVAMKKRFDMIGQLVDTAKSYMKFEKATMTEVTKMRQMPVASPQELEKANDMATKIFGRIMAVMENYPKLESIQAVTDLQRSIKANEDEVARLRYTYNDVVQIFNTKLETIPDRFIAGLMGLAKKPYLEFGQEIEQRPDTKLF